MNNIIRKPRFLIFISIPILIIIVSIVGLILISKLYHLEKLTLAPCQVLTCSCTEDTCTIGEGTSICYDCVLNLSMVYNTILYTRNLELSEILDIPSQCRHLPKNTTCYFKLDDILNTFSIQGSYQEEYKRIFCFSFLGFLIVLSLCLLICVFLCICDKINEEESYLLKDKSSIELLKVTTK